MHLGAAVDRAQPGLGLLGIGRVVAAPQVVGEGGRLPGLSGDQVLPLGQALDEAGNAGVAQPLVIGPGLGVLVAAGRAAGQTIAQLLRPGREVTRLQGGGAHFPAHEQAEGQQQQGQQREPDQPAQPTPTRRLRVGGGVSGFTRVRRNGKGFSWGHEAGRTGGNGRPYSIRRSRRSPPLTRLTIGRSSGSSRPPLALKQAARSARQHAWPSGHGVRSLTTWQDR